MAMQKKPHLCRLQGVIIMAHNQPARTGVLLHLGLADLDLKELAMFVLNLH